MADGMLEPLSTDAGEERAWLDWELASLVEGHFQQVIDPGALHDAECQSWVQKATHGKGLCEPDRRFSRPYWLLDSGKRVGTFALTTMLFGWDLLRVSSLYVEPDRRRHGITEARLRAPGTLAVHLALEGWPLMRSDKHWAERYHWSDLGMPEGLALKIAAFEAVSREQGFIVKTPIIPGLDYQRAFHDDVAS